MNSPCHSPSIEDLFEFYKLLKQRVDRLDGVVRQLQSEGTHDAISRPTWRDVEAIKKDIARLEQMLSSRRNRRGRAGEKAPCPR